MADSSTALANSGTEVVRIEVTEIVRSSLNHDHQGRGREDGGRAETGPHDVADRRLEAHGLSEIADDEVAQPSQIALVDGVEIAVLLEPDLALLFRAVGPEDLDGDALHVGPEDLDGDALHVDLHQEVQEDRHHDHGENHGAQSAQNEDQHGVSPLPLPGSRRDTASHCGGRPTIAAVTTVTERKACEYWG
jgi:hypothetical protein